MHVPCNQAGVNAKYAMTATTIIREQVRFDAPKRDDAQRGNEEGYGDIIL